MYYEIIIHMIYVLHTSYINMICIKSYIRVTLVLLNLYANIYFYLNLSIERRALINTLSISRIERDLAYFYFIATKRGGER